MFFKNCAPIVTGAGQFCGALALAGQSLRLLTARQKNARPPGFLFPIQARPGWKPGFFVDDNPIHTVPLFSGPRSPCVVPLL